MKNKLSAKEIFKRQYVRPCTCAITKKVYNHKFFEQYEKGARLKRIYPEFEGKLEHKFDWYYSNTSKDEVDVLILMEFPEPPSKLEFIKEFCHEYLDYCTFGIMPALGCTPNFEDKMDDTIVTYSRCKELNVKKRIEKRKPKVIITLGRALYTITEIKELKVDHFFVNVNEFMPEFSKDDMWLYSSEFNCKVFPIPGMYIWVEDPKEKPTRKRDIYETRFIFKQLNNVKEEIERGGKLRVPELDYLHLKDCDLLLNDLINDKNIDALAIDTESETLSYFKGDVLSIQFSWDGEIGYFCDWEDINKNLLIKLFDRKDIKFVMHNGPYDIKVLKAVGIYNARCDFDTMLASWQCNEISPNGLKPNTWIYTPYGGYEEELKSYMKKMKLKDFKDIPKNKLVNYASKDAAVTILLYRYFVKRLELEDEDVRNNFYNFVMPSVNMIAEVEMVGVPIDLHYLHEYNEKLKKDLKEVQKEAYKLAGREFNLNSDKDKNEIFEIIPGIIEERHSVQEDGKGKKIMHGGRGLVYDFIEDNLDKVFFSAKTDLLLLNKKTLPVYAEHGVELAGLILKNNHLSKEISQLGFPDFSKENNLKEEVQSYKLFTIEDEDEEETDLFDAGFMRSSYFKDNKLRIFGGYKLSGTETGRAAGGADKSLTESVKFSSKNAFGINFQFIPSTDEFRQIFFSPEDYVIGTCDYDAMEVSIFSQLAGHGVLEEFILEGKDMHCYTGTSIVEILGADYLAFIYNQWKDRDKLPLKNKREIQIFCEEVVESFDYDYFVKKKEEGDPFFKRLRDRAKFVNWRVLYGTSGFGLAKELKIEKEQGEEILEQFFNRYPDVYKYMQRQERQAKAFGFVKTLLGRKKRIPQLTYVGNEKRYFKNFSTYDLHNLKNSTFNAPVQGTSGQVTIVAMTKIWEEFNELNLKSKVIINVHDEVVFLVHKDEPEIVSNVVHKWFMKEYYESNNDVKLKAELDLGETWKRGKPWSYWKDHQDEWNEMLERIKERNLRSDEFYKNNFNKEIYHERKMEKS